MLDMLILSLKTMAGASFRIEWRSRVFCLFVLRYYTLLRMV